MLMKKLIAFVIEIFAHTGAICGKKQNELAPVKVKARRNY
jgi:hypothetical protein